MTVYERLYQAWNENHWYLRNHKRKLIPCVLFVGGIPSTPLFFCILILHRTLHSRKEKRSLTGSTPSTFTHWGHINLVNTPGFHLLVHLLGWLPTSTMSPSLWVSCMNPSGIRGSLSMPLTHTLYEYKALDGAVMLWIPSLGVTLYQ